VVSILTSYASSSVTDRLPLRHATLELVDHLHQLHDDSSIVLSLEGLAAEQSMKPIRHAPGDELRSIPETPARPWLAGGPRERPRDRA
jgi:hypothetical protein